MCTTVTNEWMTTRRMELDSDLRDLCDELNSLQARASRRVEEVENEFQDATWAFDQGEMLARLRKLVTKI